MFEAFNPAAESLISLAEAALKAVLAASPDETHDSICVLFGDCSDRDNALTSFCVGPDHKWAFSCLPYAAKKLVYLDENPVAVTSFEGANHAEELYGGGIKIKGLRLAVSGLTEIGDFIVGLLILITSDELALEEARLQAETVGPECLRLLNLAFQIME